MLPRTAMLALLFLPACAYKQAMSRGDAALAASDYDAARHAFAFAYDTKSSAAALDGMHRAQAQAIESQLDGAEAAVKASKYVEADRALREVEILAPDNPRLKKLRETARTQMMAAISVAVADENGDPRKSYELVKLARRLYSDAPEPEYALVTLRERELAKAHDQAASGDYKDALATVALVKEMEPWQAQVTDKLDKEISGTWADQFVAKAKAARYGEPGLAAVLYARAYEIAQRSEDLDSSRSMWQAAAAAGPVALYVDNGAPGESYTMKKAISTALEQTPGTATGSGSHWDLLAKIYASEPSCRETKKAEPVTKDYISGQRPVPNPDYVTAKKEFDAAQKVADDAVAKVDTLAPQEEKAVAEAARLDLVTKAKQRDLQDKDSVLTTTKSQIARWTKDVETVQAELAGLPPDDKVKRADATERLKMTRRYADEWQTKLKRDVETEAVAKKAYETANAEFTAAQAKAKKLTADRTAAEAARTTARQTLASAEAKLTPLPKTVMEDVHQTLKYDNVTWTDTCTEKVTVYLGTSWKPKPDSPQRFEVVRTTSDLAHIGHQKAGVVADPKVYPVSQHDMVAQMRTEGQQKVEGMLTGLVDGYFTSTLDQAFGTMKADEATDVLTRIYAGAPVRMDASARQKYGQFLTEHYGLQKLETLAPDTPPPPMQPSNATAAESTKTSDAKAAEAPADGSTTPAAEPGPAATPAQSPWGDGNHG